MARIPRIAQKKAAPTSSRNSDEARAAKAYAIANNPDFIAFFEDARAEIIRDLEACELNGTVDAENAALEKMRDLHALMRLKRTIFRPIAKQRSADARAAKQSEK
jgi:hypothetical protein